jgi:hypothetical protein
MRGGVAVGVTVPAVVTLVGLLVAVASSHVARSRVVDGQAPGSGRPS